MRRILPVAAMVFIAVYQATPVDRPSATALDEPDDWAGAPSSVYYPGCNAVRAAGAAPLYRGEPGYREEMDGDDDGIACEAYRSR